MGNPPASATPKGEHRGYTSLDRVPGRCRRVAATVAFMDQVELHRADEHKPPACSDAVLELLGTMQLKGSNPHLRTSRPYISDELDTPRSSPPRLSRQIVRLLPTKHRGNALVEILLTNSHYAPAAPLRLFHMVGRD